LKDIRSVLLDFDGTLLDSNAAHAVAWKEYLEQKTGLRLPTLRLASMMGMGGDKIFKKLFPGEYSEKEIRKMSDERDDYYLETQMARVKPVAGAVEFVAELARRGIKVAIASSAKQKLLDPSLKLVPIEPYIVGFSTPDEASNSKPDPDIFTAGMEKFHFEPRHTAVVGDSPYDIQAADAAQCRAVVAVRSGNYPSTDLSMADEIYKDVNELRVKLDESILMQ
jgi:HAD superfamily hydrolase (TIGR01509 family)